MCNDTLYCKYKIENKTDSVLVLYSTDYLWLKDGDEYLNSKEFYDGAWPRLWATIIDSNNEYAETEIRMVMRDRFPPDSTPPPPRPSTPIKYLILQPFQSVENDNFLILNSVKSLDDSLFEMKEWIPYIFVTNGVQKFQLEYFSGPAFRNRFRKDKQRDSRLKNSIMFEGIVKSNVCTFSYPENFTPLGCDQPDEAVFKEADNTKTIIDFQYFKWVKYVGFAVVSVLLVILFYKLIKRRL